jgi:excinuclease ABC subunit C
VEGIGPKRRKILLKAFENFEDIKSASVETLCAIEGIDSKTAHNVYDYFHKKDE